VFLPLAFPKEHEETHGRCTDLPRTGELQSRTARVDTALASSELFLHGTADPGPTVTAVSHKGMRKLGELNAYSHFLDVRCVTERELDVRGDSVVQAARACMQTLVPAPSEVRSRR
jgi:hypothetical protein